MKEKTFGYTRSIWQRDYLSSSALTKPNEENEGRQTKELPVKKKPTKIRNPVPGVAQKKLVLNPKVRKIFCAVLQPYPKQFTEAFSICYGCPAV